MSRIAWGALMVLAACAVVETTPQPQRTPATHTFAFGVFGDGPYNPMEMVRYRRLLDDVAGSDLEWFLHIGDLMGYDCSEERYAERLTLMNAVPHPVIYTPGDNEWTDCHRSGFVPLERLSLIRSRFFPEPGTSLGARTMTLETQATDAAFTEFVENMRWRRGGFLFATLHVVGSGNGTAPFHGRTPADDAEAQRRMRGALAWLEQTFAIAARDGMKGVVLALHANPDLERGEAANAAFRPFVDRLETLVEGYAGPVLLIHGDTHEHQIDHPLLNTGSEQHLTNFTRLETFGSPDIGWVRVVVDTLTGHISYEPRLQPR